MSQYKTALAIITRNKVQTFNSHTITNLCTNEQEILSLLKYFYSECKIDSSFISNLRKDKKNNSTLTK